MKFINQGPAGTLFTRNQNSPVPGQDPSSHTGQIRGIPIRGPQSSQSPQLYHADPNSQHPTAVPSKSDSPYSNPQINIRQDIHGPGQVRNPIFPAQPLPDLPQATPMETSTPPPKKIRPLSPPSQQLRTEAVKLVQEIGPPLVRQFGPPVARRLGPPLARKFGPPLARKVGIPLAKRIGLPLAKRVGRFLLRRIGFL